MALSFNPPDWLIQEYLGQKRPIDNVADSMRRLGETARGFRNDAENKRLREAQLAMLQRKAAQEGREGFYKYGDPSGLTPEEQMGLTQPLQGPETAEGVGPQDEPTIAWLKQVRASTGGLGFEGAKAAGLSGANTLDEITAQQVREGKLTLAEAYKLKASGSPSSMGVQWITDPMTGYPRPYPKTVPPGGGNIPVPSAPTTSGGQPGDPFAGLDFKTRQKRINEKPKAAASLNNTLREYDNMIAEANAIATDPAVGWATGMTSLTGSIPGTPMKRVAARLETLKAKTLLNVLASLKELSSTGASGFGQLSNIEGENLRNSISTLDRNLEKEDFRASIKRFTDELKQRRETLRRTFIDTYGDDPSLGASPAMGGSDPLGIR